MTETQMHIPQHIDMTRRIAQQEAASVTALTVQEQQLQGELDKHQQAAAAERNRIEAELREIRENADRRLAALADAEDRLKAAITDVGKRRHHHATEAEQAQLSLLDWCTRQGIEPAALPALPDTGPLPAIAAPEPTTPRLPNGRVAPPPGEIEFAGPDLPAIEDPDGLLAKGRAMADPNGDPNATQVDGGDEPAPGPFQGGSDA
jgi:hypothetical protein